MPLIYIAEDDPGIRELILYTLQIGRASCRERV